MVYRNSPMQCILLLGGVNCILRKGINSFWGRARMYLSDILRTALHYECIWIEIDYPTCNYFLCCIYLLLTPMVDFGVNISTKKS